MDTNKNDILCNIKRFASPTKPQQCKASKVVSFFYSEQEEKLLRTRTSKHGQYMCQLNFPYPPFAFLSNGTKKGRKIDNRIKFSNS